MTKVYDFDELYPGRFLKAAAFGETRPTFEISDVNVEELVGNDGPRIKAIISFKGEKQMLVACKTNGICIREMFGRKTQEWLGKRITLFASEWAGEPCIRVWGSPDIDGDKQVIIQLPRKKPITMLMRFTGQRQEQRTQASAEPAKRVHSDAVKAYLGRMAVITDTDALQVINDALVEDNSLSESETALLVRALTRRTEQLQEAAK
jgi:hypothetical protein